MMKNNRLIKRILSLLLFSVILFSATFACPVSAETEEDALPAVGQVGHYYTILTALGVDTAELREQFLASLATGDLSFSYNEANGVQQTQPALDLDLSQYAIPCEYVSYIIGYLSVSIPQAFVLTGSFVYSYEEDETIAHLYLFHNNLFDQYEEKFAECEAAAKKLLKGIQGNDSLTDAEKALLIHDRLAIWSEYNISGYIQYFSYVEQYALDGDSALFRENTAAYQPMFTLYGALVDRCAVCEGYAQAYAFLLEKAGIPNYYIASNDWCHAWNVVYIDGIPYHVDVTSDDPIADVTGRVTHDFFLLSDDQLLTAHDEWDLTYDFKDLMPEPADDTTYDSYYWQNSQTAFQLINNTLFYMDNQNSVIKTTLGQQTVKPAYFTWWANQQYAFYSLNGVTMANFAGCLLYTQTNYSISDIPGEPWVEQTPGVYRLDPATQERKLIFQAPLGDDVTTALYGITCFDGVLSYEVKATPDDDTPLASGSFLMCDVNHDNVLNVKDLVYIKKLLANGEQEFVDGLGYIETAADLVFMKRLLFFGIE